MWVRIVVAFLLLIPILSKGQLPDRRDSISALLSSYIVDNELNNLGHKYLLAKDCDKAIEVFQQMLNQLDTTIDQKRYRGQVYNYLGSAHLCVNDFEKALIYFNKGLVIRSSFNDSSEIANSYCNIGLVYGKKEDYKEALSYHESSLRLFQAISHNAGIANQFNNIGEVYYRLKQYTVAEEYFVKSIQLYEEYPTYKGFFDNYKDLGDVYFAQKEYRKASKTYQKMIVAFEDFFNHHANELSEASVKYETVKKDYENKLLNKEIKSARYRQYALGTLLFLTFMLIIVFFLNHINYKKRKQLETTELLNELKLAKAEVVIKKNVDIPNQIIELKDSKKKIDQFTNGKLNEVHWKILELIYRNPTITNNEIRETVFLTDSGIRSSFKRMYELFNIDGPSNNKRISLVIEVARIIQS